MARSKGKPQYLWASAFEVHIFRECGLYEASDLLCGEKSVTVKWIDVSLPHKKNRRYKDMAKDNPETEDIFEDNLIDSYYPQRPRNLENICLYDFFS